MRPENKNHQFSSTSFFLIGDIQFVAGKEEEAKIYYL